MPRNPQGRHKLKKKQEILDFLIEDFLSGGLLVYRGEFSLEHQ